MLTQFPLPDRDEVRAVMNGVSDIYLIGNYRRNTAGEQNRRQQWVKRV